MSIKDSCLFSPENLPFPLFKLRFWYLWKKWGVVPPSYMFYLSLSLSLLISFSNALICWMYWYPETGIACHSEDMFVSNALELPSSFFACWICDDPLGFAVPQVLNTEQMPFCTQAQDFESKPSPHPEMVMEVPECPQIQALGFAHKSSQKSLLFIKISGSRGRY